MENVNEDKNKKDEINEKRIKKYKNKISNIIKCKKFDLQEKIKENIENLLDMDLKNHEITEEEYDILNDFLQEALQVYFEIKKESILESDSKSNTKEETTNSARNFREEMKKLPILDYIPIYKGNFGEIAPKRQCRNSQLESDEKKGDER